MARDPADATVNDVWRITRTAGLVGTLVLAGCHAKLARTDVAAVLTNPTEPVRAELLRVVSDSMNGAPVTLADTALTDGDRLIVQRTPRRDARGVLLDGRDTGRPEHFRLVKSGTQCVLVHEGTGRRWVLAGASCSPR
jgi:hypothetical protein